MITNIIIRPIELRDYIQWIALWLGYNAFYGRFGKTALDPEITKTTWDRFFDESEPVYALVAELNGKLVGMTHFLFHRSTSALNPVCYLQDLFTDPDIRGKGIGRALIESVYEQAKGAGSSRVYWLTHETNTIAMKLYDQVADRSGFVQYRKLI
ncbi:MAG TPA: GNAT family N-acetyltransferase [Puia sp.]|jgi:GNAT superfamily N-acetyltransferase|nr:GNAT family N-acetyltransferase [Puia sp.]